MTRKLRMVHMAIREVLPAKAPSGFVIRASRATDQQELIRLYRLGSLGVDDDSAFESRVCAHASYDPGNVLVVDTGSGLAGTAAAFLDREDSSLGFLHMVSVDPRYRGIGLGRILVTAALVLQANHGLRRQWLLTDDWRLAAIKLYLSLGYEPDYSFASHACWEQVITTLSAHRGAKESLE